MLPKDTLQLQLLQRPSHKRACAENHLKVYRTVRRSPGNCKAVKTEMVWARDKIGRPNQSNTTGNSQRQSKKGQAEKELE